MVKYFNKDTLNKLHCLQHRDTFNGSVLEQIYLEQTAPSTTETHSMVKYLNKDTLNKLHRLERDTFNG